MWTSNIAGVKHDPAKGDGITFSREPIPMAFEAGDYFQNVKHVTTADGAEVEWSQDELHRGQTAFFGLADMSQPAMREAVTSLRSGIAAWHNWYDNLSHDQQELWFVQRWTDWQSDAPRPGKSAPPIGTVDGDGEPAAKRKRDDNGANAMPTEATTDVISTSAAAASAAAAAAGAAAAAVAPKSVNYALILSKLGVLQESVDAQSKNNEAQLTAVLRKNNFALRAEIVVVRRQNLMLQRELKEAQTRLAAAAAVLGAPAPSLTLNT